jgi:3'-phosphoadenosine 5'-phosphosulfate sulfotransferase (PAPS reductase)/FAD synthetase
MTLKSKLRKPTVKVMAFVGVRADESYSRSFYEDESDGVKNASQLNCMPILDWGAHELWLYIFANNLIVNCAYKKGLTRVGCLMCPESSEKYEWFVDRAYPRELKPYGDVIISTSAKRFDSAVEKNEFIGKRYWQARKSGIVLRDVLTPPLEEVNELSITFQSPHFHRDLFYEWIKTLGAVEKERMTEREQLKLPNTLDDGLPFEYHAPYTGGGSVRFDFRSKEEMKALLPMIRSLLRKVSGCVGCKSCEAECNFGAITTKDGNLKIDGVKCTKCRNCYEIENACWRYRSMNKPENSSGAANEFARYNNFGLREYWLDALIEKGDTFFRWDDKHPLGDKMVDSAKKWFPQALRVSEDKKPTNLVELFKIHGTSYGMAWDFIWIALVNRSPLINWYCVSTEIDKPTEMQSLLELLQGSYPLTNNAKDRRLDSLKNTAVESPLGGSNAVMLPEMKGKKVIALTRRAKDVHPLTLLYGLYLIADISGRGNFTVRELLTADAESTFVSPLVAFGITPDTFKKQCEGLRTKYPAYISTTFTHGNDGLEVFTQKHSLEDIISLALGE